MTQDLCQPCTTFRFPGRHKRLGANHTSQVACDGWLWFMPFCDEGPARRKRFGSLSNPEIVSS